MFYQRKFRLNTPRVKRKQDLFKFPPFIMYYEFQKFLYPRSTQYSKIAFELTKPKSGMSEMLTAFVNQDPGTSDNYSF